MTSLLFLNYRYLLSNTLSRYALKMYNKNNAEYINLYYKIELLGHHIGKFFHSFHCQLLSVIKMNCIFFLLDISRVWD